MSDSILDLHEKVVQGDNEAVAEVLQVVIPRLVNLAQRVAGPRDSEDAVQSAVRTYLRRTQAGQFENVQDVQDLYRLLATIACRKALKQVRKQRRMTSEAALQASPADQRGLGMETLAEAMPSQEFDLICEEWLSALEDESLKQVAVLAFQGFSQKEIAKQLGCTTRNVRFKVTRIKQTWTKLLEKDKEW